MKSENGKGNNRNYYGKYPLNLYATEKEIKLWDSFNKAVEDNFTNKRLALLQAMQLYVEKYGKKEE